MVYNKHSIAVIIIVIIWEICDAEVKIIQATIRHADRNPISGDYSDLYYPNDPYKDNDWFPDGPMELTNAGKLNAFKLGEFLRGKYENLLGPAYKPSNVRFRSAQMTRAISTLQAVAAGMFPPTEEQKWHSHLNWIPIPIHVVSVYEDKLNYALGFCENYHLDRDKSDVEVNRMLRVLSDIQQLLSFLSLHTGVNHTRSTQGWILYHQLAAQASLGLKFEPWINEIFPSGKLVDISAVEYILQTYTDRMKRLVGGAWIREFLDRSNDYIDSMNPLKKAYFHATNEIQVAAILNALGVYVPHIPGYASVVIFELHQIELEFYVKSIYRNENNVSELIIPGCETLCPLSTFKYILRNVILEDFEKDCGSRVDFQIIK